MAKKDTSKIIYNFDSKIIQFEKQEELIHNLVSIISEMVEGIEFNSFAIGFSWQKNMDKIEELRKSVQYRLNNEISEKFDKKIDFALADAHFTIDFNKKSIILYLLPVYVYGDYCKLLRGIAQTEHFCRKCRGRGCEECNNTGRIYATSVEELIAKVVVPRFNAKQLIFHGAGREDADVLMLGEGRPFVLEITFPKKRNVNLKEIEAEINEKFKEKISVKNLEFVSKEKIVEVKNGVHDKIYLAKIVCENELKKDDLEKLNLLVNKKILVEQKTPVRVLKRRVDLVRNKEIILLKTKLLSKNEIELELQTSHGTYVKEFISGDENRTLPSLSSIMGVACECKQLDVLKIVK